MLPTERLEPSFAHMKQLPVQGNTIYRYLGYESVAFGACGGMDGKYEEGILG